jgi:hypothetical protein
MSFFDTLLESTEPALGKAFFSDQVAYCDYIAHTVREALIAERNPIINLVGKVQMDLNEHGHFMSTTKTLKVVDKNGTTYKITVEQLP